MRNRILAVMGVVALAAAYLGANYYIGKRQKFGTVTVYNRGVGGVSIFLELRRKIRPDSTQLKQTAFLDDKDTKGIDAVAILSPGGPLSPRETSILTKYVDDGGTLFLSFHGEPTLRSIQPLTHRFTDAKIVPNEKFKNGEAEVVVATRESKWFRKGKRYAFYSPLIFDDIECSVSRIHCYVRVESKGKGEAVLVAGLPPFGNALIDKGDNRQLAFSLVDEIPRLTVDEYHHFFSEKTLWDLFARPEFSLPLGVMLGMVLLFFIFGRTEFHERSLSAPQTPAPVSHHEVGESITLGVIRESRNGLGTLRWHAKALRRRFPERARQIDEIMAQNGVFLIAKKELLERGRRLIRLHKEALKKRGRG